MHQKVFVETCHTDHDILSSDAADDRQHKSGWMSADHNTTCFEFLHCYLTNLFYHFVDIRHCFGLQETQASSADARPTPKSPNFAPVKVTPSMSKFFIRKCSCWNPAELRCSYWSPVECRDVGGKPVERQAPWLPPGVGPARTGKPRNEASKCG
jgi:hypothetical protein